MKAFLALLLVAAASAHPTTESYDIGLVELYKVRNSLDQLLVQVGEYVRSLMVKHQPYNFPPLPTQTLKDDDVNLQFSTSNVKLSKAETFTLDKVSTNIPSLTSTIAISVPQAHLEGNYEVTGTAFNKAVSGSGTFSADIKNFKLSGDNQFEIVDHSLQVQDIKADFSLESAQFSVEGLTIEGLTKDQIEDFLNKQFIDYLTKNKAEVVQKGGAQAKAVANKLLKGHSLQDVVQWLKDLVRTTPDPPPFPTFATIA